MRPDRFVWLAIAAIAVFFSSGTAAVHADHTNGAEGETLLLIELGGRAGGGHAQRVESDDFAAKDYRLRSAIVAIVQSEMFQTK